MLRFFLNYFMTILNFIYSTFFLANTRLQVTTHGICRINRHNQNHKVVILSFD